LLAQIGVTADAVRPVDIDETARQGELPRLYCARVARDKARAGSVAADEILLCADTTVALGRRIIGKPRDRDAARAMLRLLAGRRHRVLTSVAVRNRARLFQKTVETVVRFRHLSDRELDIYLDSGEWRGKAGGYAIQGRAAAFIPWIRGSFSAVVGLPLAETRGLLTAAGYRPESDGGP